MTAENTYLVYKRQTSRVLYWITHAYNGAIKSLAGDKSDDHLQNTTGKTTVAGLVSMVKLIASHLSQDDVPATVFRLFQSVIAARTAVHERFQQIVSKDPDPEIAKSNASHKHFVDALVESFNLLGGKDWSAKAKESASQPATESSEDDLVELANKFTALGIEEGEDDSEDEAVDATPADVTNVSRRQKPQSKGKGKKGKGRKSKGKKKSTKKQPAEQKQDLDDVPIESYRIIEDQEGITTEYLMAVYALVQDWVSLRSYNQDLWEEVAYDGLNGAVAANVTFMTIRMLKRSEATMFVEFPGHESFDVVVKTITRGDVEKFKDNFRLQAHSVGQDGSVLSQQERWLDIREQFMLHTYKDLVDFVTDFQKARTGFPTKRMQSEIQHWDPSFDLRNATEEARIKWRRAYTISWLYDLVNVYSSVVRQRIALKGEKHVLERVNWSIHGPWSHHRLIFGLQEFAGFVTTLAMQTSGTDVTKKILPHHVFELQCIVDSLMVSRGWSNKPYHGHVLQKPAKDFRPRRDVDLFLDRDLERQRKGFLEAGDYVRQILEQESLKQGSETRYKTECVLIEDMHYNFVNWLGSTKYQHPCEGVAPSRFSHVNTNGLWEFSPMLCGAGLMEGLELSYALSMVLWDRLCEPTLIVHLHNMLVEKGYISRPIGLYATFQDLTPGWFFKDGKIPKQDFLGALLAQIQETDSRRSVFARTAARSLAKNADDIHGKLDPGMNLMFRDKSALMMYRAAGWDPDRIRDEELARSGSNCWSLRALATIRLCRTKRETDPQTGKIRLADTVLTRFAKDAMNFDDKTVLRWAETFESLADKEAPSSGLSQEAAFAQLMGQMSDKGYSSTQLPNLRSNNPAKDPMNTGLSPQATLELLKTDIYDDVCGQRPVSGFNYLFCLIRLMVIFMSCEDELKKARNPTYVDIFEGTSSAYRDTDHKRVHLAVAALSGHDEELLSIMGRVFEKNRTGFIDYSFWDDLDISFEHHKKMQKKHKSREGPPDVCSVM